MKTKKLLVAFSFVICFLQATQIKAQQDPMYSMYMYDKMIINPAYAGSSNWAVGTLKYRQQFTGLSGKPVTQTFNFHAPIQKKHIGLGFKIINDKIAIVSNLNAAVALSYHLNFAGGKLSLGIEAGILNKKVDYQKLILSSQNDQALPTSKVSSTALDINGGLYYKKKQFYAGLSSYHLNGGSFKYDAPVQSQSRLYNHIYLMAGNVFELNKNVTVEPSLVLKYQRASVQVDLNATAYYKDKVGLGIQYRTGDAVCLIMRFHVTESLRIAYSYDMSVSKFKTYASGAHEIVLSYGIKLPPPPTQKEIHPRYYY